MKKLLLSTILLMAAGFCFAESKLFEEGKGFVVNAGMTYYGTERLSDLKNTESMQLQSNSFTGEIGFINSDEDGLIDFVSFNLLGFGFGEIDSKGYNFILDSSDFSAIENAKHFNIYGKDTFGLQVNIFAFSIGATIGPKYGYDRMTQSARSTLGDNKYKYIENRIFLDVVGDPYISVLLFHKLKIMFKTDFDFPIFRARFITESIDNNKGQPSVQWDWFKNDIPITYMIGAAFMF